MVDPSGQFSSPRQYWGYKIEDAIQDFYEEDHPGLMPILKSKRVFRVDNPARWLFPDVYDPNTDLWLEVKPLSIDGVQKGEAKRLLNNVALPGKPDTTWDSPFIVTLVTGENFITVNVAGVVYWVSEEEVDQALISVVLGAAAYSAKDLLKYVNASAASAVIRGFGLRPALAYARTLALTGKAADRTREQQYWGIASINSLLLGF